MPRDGQAIDLDVGKVSLRHTFGIHAAGAWHGLQRALAIPVFEARPSSEPDNEPSELATGDLDGDGRIDFVLIAHDRILIYLQES